MTDFLSLLTLMKTDSLPGDSIIMHSLSSYKKVAGFIREEKYTAIHTYLDNNRSGQECTRQFKSEFGDQVFDESPMFLPYEDINDVLRDSSNPGS